MLRPLYQKPLPHELFHYPFELAQLDHINPAKTCPNSENSIAVLRYSPKNTNLYMILFPSNYNPPWFI
jgi:hypothetical protein